MNKMLDNITVEEISSFSEEQRDLVECIGIDAYKNLVKNFSGSNVYIPKTATLIAKRRNRQIYNEFNGSNIKQLAKSYNLSEIQIRRIIAEEYSKHKGEYT